MIVTLLLTAIVLLIVYVGSQRLSGLVMGIVSIVALCGISLVVSPQLASDIARTLGVGRGTDLILYVSVIGGLFSCVYFFVRMKRIEQNLIRLAQKMTISEAMREFSDEVHS